MTNNIERWLKTPVILNIDGRRMQGIIEDKNKGSVSSRGYHFSSEEEKTARRISCIEIKDSIMTGCIEYGSFIKYTAQIE
ncbi:MAG: hypothetical protein Q8P15_00485 [Nanoarchaeota archaeon]|nr:hypothetical protein [Nanoarchaeota archaeon]